MFVFSWFNRIWGDGSPAIFCFSGEDEGGASGEPFWRFSRTRLGIYPLVNVYSSRTGTSPFWIDKSSIFMGVFNSYCIICGVPNHQAVLYMGKSTISTGPWLQELCNQFPEGIQKWQSDVTLGPHREVIEHKCPPRWFIGYWKYLIYSWFVDIYPLIKNGGSFHSFLYVNDG